MASRSEVPKLIIRVITFELPQHIRPRYHNVPDGQTDWQMDGRTDGRTSYDSNTALALRASRCKNVKTYRHKAQRTKAVYTINSVLHTRSNTNISKINYQRTCSIAIVDHQCLLYVYRRLWSFKSISIAVTLCYLLYPKTF